MKHEFCIIRKGGLGDLTILSSSLLALKEKLGGRPLVLATREQNVELLSGAPFLDRVVPIKQAEEEDWFKTIDLRYAVEPSQIGSGKLSWEGYTTRDRSDNFDELLGVQGAPKRFSVPIDQFALVTAKELLAEQKGPLIGLVPTTKSPIRCIPPEFVKPLAKLLRRLGTPVLIGKSEGWSSHLASLKMPGVLNLIDRLNIKEMVAILSLVDLVISPDSSAYHIAAALKKKAVAVFGNIHPNTRATYYPSVLTLYPKKDEIPCRKHPCWDIPASCPKEPGKYGADCMRVFTPDRIYASACRMLPPEPLAPRIDGPKRIAIVHDSPLRQYGGTELSTNLAISTGRARGHQIDIFLRGNQFDNLVKGSYDLIILNNIWRLEQSEMNLVLEAIAKTPYIKWEHDHRSLNSKAEGKYPKEIYAEMIFNNSLLNIFVSPCHLADYRRRMNVDGVPVMSLLDPDMFFPRNGNRKRKTALVVSKWKGGTEMEDFIKRRPDLRFDYLGHQAGRAEVPYPHMPEVYSRYEYMVHLPHTSWACERVIFEAALCGCKVITNSKAQGLSWGMRLENSDELRAWLKEAPGKFWREVEGVL